MIIGKSIVFKGVISDSLYLKLLTEKCLGIIFKICYRRGSSYSIKNVQAPLVKLISHIYGHLKERPKGS